MKINVTKSYLPPIDEYIEYLQKIWGNSWLTNQGPLLNELEQKLKEYLDIKNLHFISNGTVALQLAIEALNLKGSEIITTPFSFVATTTSILWENCKPVFVDIEGDNFNIDPKKIEEKITDKTKAIMCVHVFGHPCNVEEIQKIADKHGLKVIYDAAHAFGVVYKGKSLLSYGDISTCSFHATKIFHSVEGGACIANDDTVSKKLDLLKKFGFEGTDYSEVGINAKNSEFHAAMGLCVLKHLEEIMQKRKEISLKYDELLSDLLQKPKTNDNYQYNYIYYPVVFDSEEDLLKVFEKLNENEIYPRRYFYPSLNTLPYLSEKVSCPVSEDISSRIACLPLDPYLDKESITKICDIIRSGLQSKNNRKLTKY